LFGFGRYICAMKEIEYTASITEEDKKIVQMLANGMKGNQIAAKMKMNENTLAFNLSILRAKFNCSNSMSLVVYFLRNKIIN